MNFHYVRSILLKCNSQMQRVMVRHLISVKLTCFWQHMVNTNLLVDKQVQHIVSLLANWYEWIKVEGQKVWIASTDVDGFHCVIEQDKVWADQSRRQGGLDCKYGVYRCRHLSSHNRVICWLSMEESMGNLSKMRRMLVACQWGALRLDCIWEGGECWCECGSEQRNGQLGAPMCCNAFGHSKYINISTIPSVYTLAAWHMPHTQYICHISSRST